MDIQIGKRHVGRPESVSDRGIEALIAIWKRQSLGTMAVHHFVADGASLYGLSKELIKLEAKGFIEGERIFSVGFRWSITPKGFSMIEPALTARFGTVERRVERLVSDSGETPRERWHQKNQHVLLLSELLMALAPKNDAWSVSGRELDCSRTREVHPWLPKKFITRPEAFVSIGTRDICAIDYIFSGQSLTALTPKIEAYAKMKVTRVFLILEEYWAHKANANAVRAVARQAKALDRSKIYLLNADELMSGELAKMENLSTRETIQLAKLVLGEKRKSTRAHTIAKMLGDLTAKPKVWGRAYQRET